MPTILNSCSFSRPTCLWIAPHDPRFGRIIWPYNLELTDKTAVVSGSTKGIGFAIASRLAREGARVIVNGRSENTVAAAKEKIDQTVPDARTSSVKFSPSPRHPRRQSPPIWLRCWVYTTTYYDAKNAVKMQATTHLRKFRPIP